MMINWKTKKTELQGVPDITEIHLLVKGKRITFSETINKSKSKLFAYKISTSPGETTEIYYMGRVNCLKCNNITPL